MVTVPEGRSTSPSEDELYEYALDDMTRIIYQLLKTGINAGRLRSVTVEDGTFELLDGK